MDAPTNTAKLTPETHLLGMLGGGSSTYITDMESDGQRELVASSSLPIEGPWADLEALGFVKGAPVDDLFVKANLPAGWSKEGSDHAMWSYLVDERGVRRVAVFYKAAFYDRKADMHIQNVGYAASTESLYGDGEAKLPDKWDVFTAEERAAFIAGLDGMAGDIKETPTVYGKYADRVARVRALVEESK